LLTLFYLAEGDRTKESLRERISLMPSGEFTRGLAPS